MISIYYPTTEAAVKSNAYQLARYITPTVAAALSTYLGTSEKMQNAATRSYLGAPIRSSSDFPVLIFSPGLVATRIMYTTLLEIVASHGWIVVAIDHTYDALVVEFPDGRKAMRSPTLLDGFPAEVPHLVDIRVADVNFTVESPKDLAFLSQIPGLIGGHGVITNFAKVLAT